jgi:outer membrane biosynthesis protein TonB
LPKNEDGEFELVLGNKQLLSMFFVVVVLLGVFFVMGYIVGRNSAPLAAGEPSIARKADTKPLVVDSPAPKAPETQTAPAPEPSKPVETAVEKPAEAKPEVPKPEPTKPSTSKSEPAAKREAAKAEKQRPASQPSGSPTQSNQPVAGQTYLQLVATSKHDADATVEVLRKNNFPALDAEVPEKPGLFRVLVGPVPPGEVNKTKAELQGKGFQGNAAIRKTF